MTTVDPGYGLNLNFFYPSRMRRGCQILWHSTARAKKVRLTVRWFTRCKRRQKRRQRVSERAAIVPEMSVVLYKSTFLLALRGRSVVIWSFLTVASLAVARRFAYDERLSFLQHAVLASASLSCSFTVAFSVLFLSYTQVS